MPGCTVAVLYRHHRYHLEAARTEAGSQQDVPFSSGKVWRRVETELQSKDYLDIYFVPVGSDLVEYAAHIVGVRIEPDVKARDIQQILAMRVSTTQSEDWSEAQTIYLIRNCHKLENPIPKTELIKEDGGEPISAGFERGYALVCKRSGLT